jgi:hypothetical protein
LLYSSSEQSAYQSACDCLKKNGSAAMWECYCKNGGVRIKTTVGKVKSLVSKDFNLTHGKVNYNPTYLDQVKTVRDALFYKSPCYRYENEYRFIFPKKIEENIIERNIDNLRDFIDEMLVSPSVKDNEWVSRVIYQLTYRNKIVIQKDTTNSKDGHQYCKISQLYENISEELL